MLKRVVINSFLLLAALSCNIGSNYSDLPPEMAEKVKNINKEIKKLENDLKFMVLEKQKADGEKKNRLIQTQQKLTGRIKRLNERRAKIYARYKKK